MEFTGERLVPGKVPVDLYREHITRYLFAKQWVKPGHRVLDLGCGAGYGSAELAAETGAAVVGVDISREAVDYAASTYGRDGVQFAEMDCRELAFADGSFDLVVSYEVIEHIEEVSAYLAGIRRILREDGVFIVSTPNKRMYSDALPDYDNPYHVKEYYYQEFKDLLASHFPHVSIYLQDFMQGIAIKPHGEAVPPADGPNRIELEPGTVDAEQSSFFLAVCSARPLPVVQEMLFPFGHSNILAEKDRHIEELKKQLALRDESVTALLAHSEVEVAKRDQSVEALRRETEELNRWVSSLQAEVAKRDEAVHALQQSMLHLEAEQQAKAQTIAQLEQELRARQEQIAYLKVEADKVLNVQAFKRKWKQ